MWRLTALACVAGCTFQPAATGGPSDAGPGGDAADANPDASVDAPAMPDAPVVLDAPMTTLACPASYILHDAARPASYYRLVTGASWRSAEATCEADASASLPTHLIVLDDQAELTWANTVTPAQQWIGETDRITEGTFLAVTTQSPYVGSGFFNTGNRDCLLGIDATRTSVDRCRNFHPFLCECDGLAAVATNF